jgi:hypothetical protein
VKEFAGSPFAMACRLERPLCFAYEVSSSAFEECCSLPTFFVKTAWLIAEIFKSLKKVLTFLKASE